MIVLLATAGPAVAEEALLESLRGFDDPARTAALQARLADRAEAGDAGAQYWLGRLLHDFVPLGDRDYAAARGWLERAADGDHVPALEMLARIHETGFMVPVDRDAAVAHLERALALGSAAAGYDRARLEFGREPRDDEAVARFLAAAAELGHVAATTDLGYLHASGAFGEVDGKQAERWGNRGAALGDPRAMALLARLHANGLGVDTDPVEALKWAVLAHQSDGGDAALELLREIAAAVPDAGHDEARDRARAWLDER